MKISAITANRFPKQNSKNKTVSQKTGNIPFNTINTNIYPNFQQYIANISFKQFPWTLNQPSSRRISADEGIELYEKLKLGNYLDIDGDSTQYEQKIQRKNNLAFLDKITDKNEQKKFINYFKNLTGFPDMPEVSRNIKDEFVSASYCAEKACKKQYPFDSNGYGIICCGYDGVSSVAHSTALPGSDLDKAFIIIKGNNSDRNNETFVNNFKAQLWENTDQRILSYNHDADSFPKVYTEKQILAIVDSINEKASEMDLDKKEFLPCDNLFEKLFKEKKYKTKRQDYQKITNEYKNDYIEANSFLIDLSKKYKSAGTWENPIDTANISREDIYRASFILEAMLKGEILTGQNILRDKDTKNITLLNLSQIGSLKGTEGHKKKYVLRRQLTENFNKWDTQTQFNFIKEIIKSSSSDETGFDDYFQSDTAQKFTLLMDTVGVGK